ncbi:DegV family protein [Faecalicatena contorta]|uniref:DegV family protein n=1 Tax=Faecalicatena fissicatena TaxID=290055 RepID=A0ABS2E4H1_9FIRM|nr:MULTISPECIES: DegV family protein [Clostridia]MBM6683994.1 DegV family protein [Faecalicatena contorta]MBM6711758.1 DegV family protein [Faecalicatena contorta]MBM6736504.1 DegV family protein [Faecalicatena fissicatena]HIX99739.1 DegV family protein [Candidatus Dorea intestinigallinarum]
MKKVAVMTDSNSGITQKEARKLGIRVVPMPFYIDGELYYEDITLTQKEFYEKLSGDADISTSQPSPADVMEIWEELLDEYDEVVHIPMSSGLSTSCETAMMLAKDFDGRVFVVNNQRISVTQRQAVLDALELAAAGRSGQEIHDILMREKLEASIYITVDTLKYLKKGGRVTPAAAALGTVLNLKPVLTIQGEKLDAFAKVRGLKSAKKVMKEAMEKDIKERFRGKRVHLEAAHTCTEEEAAQWKKELEEYFPGYDIHMDALSLSVACHIGPGAMAVACSRYVEY